MGFFSFMFFGVPIIDKIFFEKSRILFFSFFATSMMLCLEFPIETFQVLKKFNIYLNPTKCAFEISSKKFLEFIVHQSGVNVNPEKLQPILKIRPP